jgi:hypothetical protein
MEFTLTPIISNQAIILTVCNFIIFMLMFANIFISKQKSKTIVILGLIFIVIPIMIIQIYSLNCMVTGSCVAWSWTLSIIAIVLTLVYVIGFIAMIMKLKRNAGPTQEEQLK